MGRTVSRQHRRQQFILDCMDRDNNQCAVCGCHYCSLFVFEIDDRSKLGDSEFVTSNGITLCSGKGQDNCRWKAERYHATGTAHPGYSPEELRAKIK